LVVVVVVVAASFVAFGACLFLPNFEDGQKDFSDILGSPSELPWYRLAARKTLALAKNIGLPGEDNVIAPGITAPGLELE
jgi:hypothetical protein